MNEAQTRQDLIDPKLRDAGWYDTEGARIRPEFPITKGALIGGGQRSSTLAADYVLQYRNRNVGVIEAKKRDLPYTEGVAQAKDYAERMQIRFAYATNGLKIYRIDMKLGQEEEVDRFPTPEELYDATFAEANEWRDKLFSVPFEDKGGAWQPRYYQENAISRVLEAVANEEDRILLTLATGTGKTAISFQIAWKLFHAKWSLQRDGTRRPASCSLPIATSWPTRHSIHLGPLTKMPWCGFAPRKSKSGGRSKRTGASSSPSSKRS